MQTITIKLEDSISDKFLWLLSHFDKNEISIIDKDEYISEDEYLRSIDGMVESILEARNEPIEKGVTLDELEW
jgi:PHD/YefM family antitoxin component YafN of YafNO toxin-antitoxin module